MTENGLRYKYILFDLDGTLTDSKEGICKSAQYALHKMGIEEPDIDKLVPFIGPPLMDTFQNMYGMDEEKAKEAVKFYRERFSVVGLFENELYPGIIELLEELRKKGAKIAIASGKPQEFIIRILEHFNISNLFDAVVGSEFDGTRGKKSEEIEEALKQIYGEKVDRETLSKDTVMVGDRCFDIEGAKYHNIASIGAVYGFGSVKELKKSGADYLAKDINKLREILITDSVSSGKDSSKNVAIDENLKKEAKGFFIKNDEIPKGSFMRAVYVLTPFALYYLVNSAATVIALMFYNQYGLIHMAGFLKAHPYFQALSISMFAAIVGIIVLFFMYRKKDKLYLSVSKSLPLCFVGGGLLAIGLNLFFGYLCTWIPFFARYSSEASTDATIPIAVAIFYHGIVVPISEEMTFRYLVYGRARNILGINMAALMTALFFGLYHGSLLQGMYAFIMGLFLCYVYEWTRSFLSCLLLHMAANIAVLVSPYLPEGLQRIITSGTSCALCLGIGIAIMLLIKKWNEKTEEII